MIWVVVAIYFGGSGDGNAMGRSLNLYELSAVIATGWTKYAGGEGVGNFMCRMYDLYQVDGTLYLTVNKYSGGEGDGMMYEYNPNLYNMGGELALAYVKYFGGKGRGETDTVSIICYKVGEITTGGDERHVVTREPLICEGIYPNPTMGVVNLKITVGEMLKDKLSINIYDVLGRRIKHREIMGLMPGRYEVRMMVNHTGVYFIMLKYGEMKKTYKLVKID